MLDGQVSLVGLGGPGVSGDAGGSGGSRDPGGSCNPGGPVSPGSPGGPGDHFSRTVFIWMTSLSVEDESFNKKLFTMMI